MSTHWMLVIVLVIVLVGARVAVWCCDPLNASTAELWLNRKRRKKLQDQELRDVDAWLKQIQKGVAGSRPVPTVGRHRMPDA